MFCFNCKEDNGIVSINDIELSKQKRNTKYFLLIMPFVGKICNRGLWDESIPGIIFDNNGVSNYAHLHDSRVKAYPRGEKGLEDSFRED